MLQRTLSFAVKSMVEPEQTRSHIETLMRRVGAARFLSGYDQQSGYIAFELASRRFRFTVPMPRDDDEAVLYTPTGVYRPLDKRATAKQQLERTRWRTLLLSIKARLAEVEVGLVTVDEAFLANMVLPSGRTVVEETREPIRLCYEGRDVPMLALPNGGGMNGPP